MPLNFPSNPEVDDTYTSAGTTWTFNGTAWNVSSGGGGGGGGEANQNAFSNVAVAGQNTVSADTTTDTLTLVAGTNITITTDDATDSVTINSTASGGGGGSSNSFETIAVAGQSNVVAESSTDTLTLIAGGGIVISTDAGTDSITISNNAQGVLTFSTLTDISSAQLTVDEIYLPAITSLDVTNSGASAYLFDQYSGSNPTLYAISGTTIAFKLQASGHPFLIQDPSGNNYSTGLIHVSTAGVVSEGAAAQGKDSGTLYWKIPFAISGGYRYQCAVHGPMVGNIVIKNFVAI